MQMVLLAFIDSAEFLSYDLFTKDSLIIMGVLTVTVYVASNSLQQLFNFNPRWLALLIAEVLSLATAFISNEGFGFEFVPYAYAMVNGLMAYIAAYLITTLTGGMGRRPGYYEDNGEIDQQMYLNRDKEAEWAGHHRTFTTNWW